MSQTPYPSIIDGHNDTVLSLLMPNTSRRRTFFEKSSRGHLDLPRAIQGGLGGGFFPVFVPRAKHRPTAPSERQTWRTRVPPPLDRALRLLLCHEGARQVVGSREGIRRLGTCRAHSWRPGILSGRKRAGHDSAFRRRRSHRHGPGSLHVFYAADCARSASPGAVPRPSAPACPSPSQPAPISAPA